MRTLTEPEYTRIWDAFTLRFDFRTSYGGPYPGITEPDPSITFELPEEHTDRDIDEFSDAVHQALHRCAAGTGEIYYLDWQHDCHAFELSQEEPRRFNGFPDGDYAIFLAPDLSFGSFGHPWERTICFFGKDFIEQILRSAPRLLSEVKRSRGVEGLGRN
jgi:hypothetical protein